MCSFVSIQFFEIRVNKLRLFLFGSIAKQTFNYDLRYYLQSLLLILRDFDISFPV